MAAVIGTVARHFQPPPPPPDAPTPFRFAEPGSFARRLEAAGFADVREQTFSETGTFPGTAENFWEMTQEIVASLLTMLSRADEGAREQVIGDIISALRALEQDGTLTFPAVAHVATARKA